MILCWGEGHGSAIHDHADAHCFMKMLRGELQEVRYAWPSNGTDTEEKSIGDIGMNDEHLMDYDGEELQEISRTTLETDGVCYINGMTRSFELCFRLIFHLNIGIQQIRLDFIGLKILATVTVPFRCIYTVLRSILVRYLTKRRENEPAVM